MLRNLHLLMALPNDRGDIAFSAKRAEHLPIEGLRIYFPSGHFNRLDKIAYWLKRLTANPVPWVRPSEAKWQIDIAGVKASFEKEISKSYPYKSEVGWPAWLEGSISLTPDFESGADFQPRLVFYITELVVAKAHNPLPGEAISGAIVVHQHIEGGYHVSSDQFHISNVSGQIGAIGANAKTEGNTFSQAWTQATSGIEFPALASELALLRAELRKIATDLEHDQAVASIGAAEVAAKKNDGEGALKHLKAAGKWALDTATKIGTQVAVKAIENAIKLP
ncbi:hypothetical protein JQR84_24390 (plasmid) [Pseudomonas luteola]|uniref:hypothetical protein n=1 Tax=Pseudomonas TaxID=286 RepID=UPI003D9FEC98